MVERLHKVLGQLRKLQFLPVDMSTKTRIIRAKTYPGVMYGIEPNDFTEQQFAMLASAVIGVFTRRNNMHDVDCFVATCSEWPEGDPVTRVIVRSCLEVRRTICKRPRTREQMKHIMTMYVREAQALGKDV